MARIRSLKPEAFQSETLANVSLEAERTFFGLSTQADDRGRFRWQPKTLNGILWSERGNHAVGDFELELKELQAEGAICHYVGCDGKTYGHLIKWDSHQKVDRPTPSRVPPCLRHQPQDADEKANRCPLHEFSCPGASTNGVTREPSASPPRVLPTDLDLDLDRGSGIVDHSATLPALHADEQASAQKRAEPITRAYYDAMNGMCKWPAILGIVKKAISSGRYADESIRAALLRMAAEGRPVTVDSLRIELDGLPARASPVARAEQKTADKLALVARLQAEERQT